MSTMTDDYPPHDLSGRSTPSPPSTPSTSANTPIVTPHHSSSSSASTSPSQICSQIFAMASSALTSRSTSRSEFSNAPCEPGPSGHRRSRSRDFWTTLGFPGSKMMIKEDDEDVEMEIEQNDTSISLVLPPSLPKCTLSAAFQCSDTHAEIPPAFYPGQAIPTILTFQLDRYSLLPHALNPALTMSLVGTLHTPSTPSRTIICVSVSLAEGLALWARDAANAYAGRVGRDDTPDVSLGLPGGTYSLPLTVQVPSTPRLPPTFSISGASFAVEYALTVTLTCDDPHKPGNRLILAEAGKRFEMMPETMPTRPSRFPPQSFWVRMDNESTGLGIKGSLSPKKPNHRWTIAPSIPTTAFSPTNIIPLSLDILPPPEATPDQKYQILIRLSIARRENSSLLNNGGLQQPIDTNNLPMVSETEIMSRWGWIETCGVEAVRIQDIEIPLMLSGQPWKYGFSTHLNVGPATQQAVAPAGSPESISVSSTFFTMVTLAFLPVGNGHQDITRYLPQSALDILPEPGHFTEPEMTSNSSPGSLPMLQLRKAWPGTIKTLPLPIIIGSVAEPRGAMHVSRWSDLQLDHNGEGGSGGGRMIHGESISCEDGWVVPPPAYREALKASPYVYL